MSDDCTLIKKLRTLKQHSLGTTAAWCFCAALIINLFCNSFSPFFIPEGAMDPGCFYAEACAIAHGYLPYHDFIDVKGPLLFFIYTLGYILTPTYCGGIFCLYTIATWGTLVAYYRTAELFSLSPRAASLAVGLAACGLFFRFTVCGGAQPEHLLVLPFAWVLYYTTAFLKHPTAHFHLPLAWWLSCGASCTFWVKYNFVLPYVAVFAVVLWVMLKERKGHDILNFFIRCIIGTLLIFTPFIIYFTYWGLWGDFWHSYFILNIESNSHHPAWMTGDIHALLLKFGHPCIWVSYLVLLHAIIRAWFKKSDTLNCALIKQLFPIFLITFLSCFIGIFGYYYMIMAPTVIFLCIDVSSSKAVELFLQRHFPLKAVIFSIIFIFGVNTYCLGQLGWGRSAESIQKIGEIQDMISRINQPKIVYYKCPDIMLGRKAASLPGTPAWMHLQGIKSENYARRDQDIALKKVDFIITSGSPLAPHIQDLFKNAGYETRKEAELQNVGGFKNVRIWALPQTWTLCTAKRVSTQ